MGDVESARLDLTTFWDELRDRGRATVPPWKPTLESLDDAYLQSWDGVHRAHAPRPWPALDFDAARYASEAFHLLSALFAYRELTIDVWDAWHAERRSRIETWRAQPEAIASVDLAFASLPQLHRMVVHRAPGDALVERVEALGRAWPLSSIGMGELGVLELDAIWSHAGLRTAYLERIVQHADASRLADARVREALRILTQEHPGLAGALAETLTKEEPIS